MRGFTRRWPKPLLAVALLGLAVGACDRQEENTTAETAAQQSAVVQGASPGKLRQDAIAWLQTRVPLQRPGVVGTELHANQRAVLALISELKASLRESDKAGAAAADAVTLARLQVAHEAAASWHRQALPSPVAPAVESAEYLSKLELYKKEIGRFDLSKESDVRALADLKRRMLGQ